MQQHLLEDCKLVDMIMEKMRFYHRRREEEKTVENFESITEEEKNAPIKAQHSSISGNLVLIAQVIAVCLKVYVDQMMIARNCLHSEGFVFCFGS